MPMIKCEECGEEYYLPTVGSISSIQALAREHKEKCFREMVKSQLLRIIELLEQKK